MVLGLISVIVVVGLSGVVGVAVATATVNDLTDRLVPAKATNEALLSQVSREDERLHGADHHRDPGTRAPRPMVLSRLSADRRALAGYASGDAGLAALVEQQDAAVADWLERAASGGPPSVDGFVDFQTLNHRISDHLDREIARAREDAARQRSLIVGLIAAVAALGTVVALVFGRLQANHISRPLVELHAVVERLAAGEQDARATPQGPREIRKVAHAFNGFVDDVQRVRELELEAVKRLTLLDAAKSDFVSNVSHELRSPLTSIAGYVELFGDAFDDGLTPQQEEMMTVVKRNVERLRALIEDLLTLSKAESGAFRTMFDLLDLNHLASDVAFDLQATANLRGITIRAVLADEPMVMNGDATQLSRALVNLVSNAVKFSRDDGEVTVAVSREGGNAVLKVIDQGIGVPAGELSQLSSRFFRASNAVKAEIGGTGLGLRIVRAIAANHGGRLEVESVEGQGTTARVVLPLERGVPLGGVRRAVAGMEEIRPVHG